VPIKPSGLPVLKENESAAAGKAMKGASDKATQSLKFMNFSFLIGRLRPLQWLLLEVTQKRYSLFGTRSKWHVA
jgi:hypothetical protein